MNRRCWGFINMTRFFSFFLCFAEIAGKRVFSPELEMESRIIGGQESWAHSWPWQVSLQFAAMPACGGAIISPLWVISAAHCFKRSEFSCQTWTGTNVGPGPFKDQDW